MVVELVVEVGHGPVGAFGDSLTEGGGEAVGEVDVQVGVEILGLGCLVGVGGGVEQGSGDAPAGFGHAAGEARFYQAQQLAVFPA